LSETKSAVSVNADTTNDLHSRLVALFADIFMLDLGPGTDDVRRRDVELWDSVNHLRLVMELEQTFEIALSDEEVLEMDSLRGVESILVKRGVTGPT
jgi:acyl carrier protein